MGILHAWMPENKGLASGIVTSGFGAGTLIFARVQLATVASSVVRVEGLGDVRVYEDLPSFFIKSRRAAAG